MKKIALIQPEVLRSWEPGEIDRIRCLVNSDPGVREFEIVEDPDEADLLVLLESCTVKSHKDIEYYQKWIDSGYRGEKKLLVINYEDTPPGVLPGLYSSLEQTNFDCGMHRSWPHLKFPNEYAELSADDAGVDVPYLFSFAGSCSHFIRKKIFKAFSSSSDHCSVREIRKWYNHEPEEKTSYVTEICRSRFVLCPHGIASYSHRIIETMALGRVPVIIADNWIPFSIEQENYYIRIMESDVDRIDEILQSKMTSYESLRQNVKMVYDLHFSPGSRYRVALNVLVELSDSLPPGLDGNFLRERMHSRKFWTVNGWLLRQRFLRIAKWEVIKCLRFLKGMVVQRLKSY